LTASDEPHPAGGATGVDHDAARAEVTNATPVPTIANTTNDLHLSNRVTKNIVEPPGWAERFVGSTARFVAINAT
jgi:hypothetical protein